MIYRSGHPPFSDVALLQPLELVELVVDPFNALSLFRQDSVVL
jgi:hypothetical protein